MGAAQCVPRGCWKPNEPTECATEQQTERLLVAENLLSVTHTHVRYYLHTHTREFRHTNAARNGHARAQTHPNRNEPISRHQTISMRERWREKEGGSREENATETPSHSDTFKEAHVARGKSILTQRVGNVARCVGWHWYYSQRETEEEKVKGVQTQREEDGSVEHSSLTQESADDQEERPLTFNKWYYCGHGNTSPRGLHQYMTWNHVVFVT